MATGTAGFNCDFHAIRRHGEQAVLDKHYVPRRSQRTRAVLTFFAQDHASSEMVYANADITKANRPARFIAFADYWRAATGADPGLLVFDSQLTTYKILDHCSPATYPATQTPPRTGAGGTSSTPPAPCTSPPPSSPVPSTCAATTRS